MDYSGAIFVSLCTIAAMVFVLNSSVCTLVLFVRRLRTPANGFLASLALSDALTGGVFFPTHLTGRGYPVNGYLVAFILLSGIGNICAITLDRYVAVRKPLKHPNMTKKWFKSIVFMVWFTPLIVSLVPLAWQTNASVLFHKVYLIFLLVICISLPYTLVFAAYYQIHHAIKLHHKTLRSRTASVFTQNRARRGVAEDQVTKALLAVIILFFISWLPIIYLTVASIIQKPVPLTLPTVSLFTVGLSSLFNPVIYALSKKDFRREIRLLFQRNPTVHVANHDGNVQVQLAENSRNVGFHLKRT